MPHWTTLADDCPSSAKVSPMRLAVHHLLQCQPFDIAVAVLDSLLHLRVISEQWLAQVLADEPGGPLLAAAVDARAESGIESIARVRLRALGFLVEPQVVVSGVGRLDLLIDGWLGIELDGREFHAQVAAFTADRTRDGLLVQQHRDVLHFGYAHVMHDWDFVVRTIEAALLRRP